MGQAPYTNPYYASEIPKTLITNRVYSIFVISLHTSATCTIIRDSVAGFG